MVHVCGTNSQLGNQLDLLTGYGGSKGNVGVSTSTIGKVFEFRRTVQYVNALVAVVYCMLWELEPLGPQNEVSAYSRGYS